MAQRANKTDVSGETTAPATDTTASVEQIPWKEAVARGKAIMARQVAAERSKYELGELAHKVVHPEYGDRTLAKFAKVIGENPKRLEEYRSVYRKWDGAGIFAPGQISFAVLKELMNVPDRAELVAAEPNMSKRRAEALRVLKDHPEIRSEHPDLTCSKQARDFIREATGDTKGSSEWTKHHVKLFKGLVEFGIDITNAIEGTLAASPDKQREFFQVVQPLLMTNLQMAGAMVTAFVDQYHKFQDETAEAHPAEATIAHLQAAE